jgi:hypothetical protein
MSAISRSASQSAVVEPVIPPPIIEILFFIFPSVRFI